MKHLNLETANLIKTSIPSNPICNNLSNFYSIFSDTTRLKILISLCLGEMCVNDLSQMLNINQTTVSHQLKILKNCGVVSSCRQNKFVFYKITDKSISNIMVNGVDFYLNKRNAG